MSTDILSMLQHRQEQFEQSTKDILTTIAPVLAGIVTFFGMTEEARVGQITWEEVYSSTSVDGEDQLITITGRLRYKVGDMFKFPNGKEVAVTVENQQYLSRQFRVGLPVPLFEEPSESDTIDFLKITEAIKKAESEFAEEVDVYENEDFEEIEITTPDTQGFDLTKLTPAQRSSYLMLLSTSKKRYE